MSVLSIRWALIVSLALLVTAEPTPSGQPQVLPLAPLPENDAQPKSDIVPVTEYINIEALLSGEPLPPPPPEVLEAVSDHRVKRQSALYQYQNSNQWPFYCVGRISGPGFACTGALVGRKLVLTARHCAVTEGSYSFSPAFSNDATPRGTANVIYKAVPAQTANCGYVQQDFAFMAIDTDFGPNYFDYMTPNSSYYNKAIFTQMGYPNSGTTYRQDQISISEQSGDCKGPNGLGRTLLKANAISDLGSSGSPLWTFPAQIFGVTSSVDNLGQAPTYYAAGAEIKATLNNLRAYFG